MKQLDIEFEDSMGKAYIEKYMVENKKEENSLIDCITIGLLNKNDGTIMTDVWY